MTLWVYHGTVWARAWRDTVAFLKAQVLAGLVIAILTAAVTGVVSADIGETFNVRVAVYAAIMATVVVAFFAFGWNLMAAPWRMHEEQAARLREFERRPDVGRLVELRERGVQLLNRAVQSDQELAALQATLRAWEDETIAELEKCATRGDVSAFRILGSMTAVSFSGVFSEAHNREKMMLNERLIRLLAVINRFEGGS